MRKTGKKFHAAAGRVDRAKRYSPDDALGLLAEARFARFDESVDVAIRLGVNPKQPDQNVRGSLVLPNGTGKSARVLVLAKGEKQKEAREAGADHVGAEEMIEKVREGWMEFDKVVATPDIMSQVGKIGKILGPRGLMPSPKVGTVTFNVAEAVKEVKAGKVEYRVGKNADMHVSIGKVSFGAEKLKENLLALMESIIRAKPASAKGAYLKRLHVSSTMGPGIEIDPASVQPRSK